VRFRLRGGSSWNSGISATGAAGDARMAGREHRPARVPVLDTRWRPDGSGRRVYAAGHIPGATYLDWRTDLVEADDEGDVLLLAGPQRVTAAATRTGLGNGMIGVPVRRHRQLLRGPAWWSLRVYGFGFVPHPDGRPGRAWRALAQPVSAAL